MSFQIEVGDSAVARCESPHDDLASAWQCADAFYNAIYRDWPGAANHTVGDCILSYSGEGHLTGANHVWPRSPEALTSAVLDEAVWFFAPYRAAWSVIYADPFMPDAAELLTRYRFSVRWQSPLMTLKHPAYRLPVHASATPFRATTLEHLHDVCRVMSEAFGTSESVNQRIARATHLGRPDILHYLITLDDQPACCATVTISGGMAGIWNVGTCFRFRRQRLATTIMAAILDDLDAWRIPASMLLASPSGHPLYLQLGYQQIGTVVYMAPPPSLTTVF